LPGIFHLITWPYLQGLQCQKHLSRRRCGGVGRLLICLRKAKGKAAAEGNLKQLHRFLHGKNALALATREDAGDELSAVHRLSAPRAGFFRSNKNKDLEKLDSMFECSPLRRRGSRRLRLEPAPSTEYKL